MECELVQDAISARLDGEDPGLEATVVAEHLEGCATCRSFESGAEALHRRSRVRAAEAVPDLAEAILRKAAPIGAASTTPSTPPAPTREWARYGLLAIALTQAVIALPALILGDQSGATVHLARELGSWDVALAAAWLVVAWAPKRAAGLLPFTAALAVIMFLTAALDMLDGTAKPWSESHHILDLAGLALIWVLARSTPSERPLLPTRHHHHHAV